MLCTTAASVEDWGQRSGGAVEDRERTSLSHGSAAERPELGLGESGLHIAGLEQRTDTGVQLSLLDSINRRRGTLPQHT